MIENAVKFQKKSDQTYKFIRIGIKKDQSEIKISLVDNGIGIKEADQDHMYKMFSKAALEHQNVGLGLYIVKQCLSKLDGTINLLRNKEKLTEFEIRIPFRS
jgi:sensor histidine kinase regulating citrate/malate metabolism